MFIVIASQSNMILIKFMTFDNYRMILVIELYNLLASISFGKIKKSLLVLQGGKVQIVTYIEVHR
jgi:hypothetical protein